MQEHESLQQAVDAVVDCIQWNRPDVRLFSPYIDRFMGPKARLRERSWTIHLATETSDRLHRFILGRQRDPAALDAFATLLHECFHTVSPRYLSTQAEPARERSRLGHAIEEGLAQWNSAALLAEVLGTKVEHLPRAFLKTHRGTLPQEVFLMETLSKYDNGGRALIDNLWRKGSDRSRTTELNRLAREISMALPNTSDIGVEAESMLRGGEPWRLLIVVDSQSGVAEPTHVSKWLSEYPQVRREFEKHSPEDMQRQQVRAALAGMTGRG